MMKKLSFSFTRETLINLEKLGRAETIRGIIRKYLEGLRFRLISINFNFESIFLLLPLLQ